MPEEEKRRPGDGSGQNQKTGAGFGSRQAQDFGLPNQKKSRNRF
jgi:hypothetical protein